jgi:hypothetical protein
MGDKADLEDIVMFLVGQTDGELSITKLMKLVFLADVEHQQLYGESLTGADWVYHLFGPFTSAVYDAAASLEEKDVIVCTIRPALDGIGRRFAPADRRSPVATPSMNPKAQRALANVLRRYGSLTVQQIKQVAYDTATMRHARRGERLALSSEPRRTLGAQVPGLAAFVGRAPSPVVRDVGDPDESAAEDAAILGELDHLRREANRELG